MYFSAANRLTLEKIGCGGWTRTTDHRINNPALYQLSYTTAFVGRMAMVGNLAPDVNSIVVT